MEVKEYVKKVAELVGGEVKEVQKNNCVKLGIVLNKPDKLEGDNIAFSPVFYVYEAYNNGVSPEDAALYIKNRLDTVKAPQLPSLKSYEDISDKLDIRLYKRGSFKYDVSKSAEEYGFNDLDIIPYIILKRDHEEEVSTRVTADFLKMWGKTVDEVINDALNNIEPVVSRLDNVIAEFLTKAGVDEPLPEGHENPILMVTNEFNSYGASAILKIMDSFKKVFTNGFAVIPSSIHEVLVINLEGYPSNTEELSKMVTNVNGICLKTEDILSDHAYIF